MDSKSDHMTFVHFIPFRRHDDVRFSLITAKNEGLMSDMTTSSRQISITL
jgi:hypothetical protein